ncbi:MAG: intradiol ring-cleavage dioxygenase [Planctomycetaceae bacterium]|nr:intradiol ring-cleavage dioxygenase [Planctomycetaceae bacterium]
MNPSKLFVPRRELLLRGGALGLALFTTPGLFAEQLLETPAMTEGPFYPDKLPLDQDNDLILVGDSTTPAVGDITHLTGRILSAAGEPVRNATIEIWQCDANAVYLHTADSGKKQDQQDKNFQGYGRFETNAKGEYRFRTIRPVPYPGRPSPHIHFKISKGDRELLTSQIFIAGHEGQGTDRVFLGLRDPNKRKLVETAFNPIPDSKLGEFAASFDVVLGRTPSDEEMS